MNMSWSLTLRRGNNLQVLESKVSSKMFLAKRDERMRKFRIVYNKKTQNLKMLPAVVRAAQCMW
jgi:hypothetical protein